MTAEQINYWKPIEGDTTMTYVNYDGQLLCDACFCKRDHEKPFAYSSPKYSKVQRFSVEKCEMCQESLMLTHELDFARSCRLVALNAN